MNKSDLVFSGTVEVVRREKNADRVVTITCRIKSLYKGGQWNNQQLDAIDLLYASLSAPQQLPKVRDTLIFFTNYGRHGTVTELCSPPLHVTRELLAQLRNLSHDAGCKYRLYFSSPTCCPVSF